MANMLSRKAGSVIRRLGMNQCPAGMPVVDSNDLKGNNRRHRGEEKGTGKD
jgi:hypothetical protein